MYSLSMLDGSCQTNSSSSLSLSRWRNSAAHRALSRGFPSFHIKVGGLVIAIKKVGCSVGGGGGGGALCFSLDCGGMTSTSCCNPIDVGLGWIWLCGFGWIQVCGSQGGAYLGLYLGPVF